MAQPKLIYGSWDELSAHAHEFLHRHDLVLMIPGDPEEAGGMDTNGVSLAVALKGKTGLVSFEPADLSEGTGRKFADLLIEKSP